MKVVKDDKGYTNVSITQGQEEPTAMTDCDKTPFGWCVV